MKVITVPEAVKLVDPMTDKPMKFVDPDTGRNEEKTLSFKEFMMNSVMNDDKHFGGNLDSIETCFRIRNKIRETLPGQSFTLDESDYKLFLEAVKNPSKGYSPMIVCQCLAFTDAVKNAASS